MTRSAVAVAILLACSFGEPAAAQTAPTTYEALGRDILRELIETNTTYTSGSTTRASCA